MSDCATEIRIFTEMQTKKIWEKASLASVFGPILQLNLLSFKVNMNQQQMLELHAENSVN